MTEDTPVESCENSNRERHKESCKYAVEISKQFMTLGVAAIAFVVSLLLAEKFIISKDCSYTLMVILGISVLFGIIFLMSVVGHINRTENYDVYTGKLRFFASGQVILFFVAMVVIGYSVVNYPIKQTGPNTANMTILIKDKQVTYPIPTGADISVKIDEKDNVGISVHPLK